jgi:hypothetical protein
VPHNVKDKHNTNNKVFIVSNKPGNTTAETTPSSTCGVLPTRTATNNPNISANPCNPNSPTTNLYQLPFSLQAPSLEHEPFDIDFSNIIREQYKGQVTTPSLYSSEDNFLLYILTFWETTLQIDDAILDHVKYHNASCLAHIHNFSTALKSAITKENTTLAIKLISHQNNISGTGAIISPSDDVAIRRRKFDDMRNQNDSGSDGNVKLFSMYGNTIFTCTFF